MTTRKMMDQLSSSLQFSSPLFHRLLGPYWPEQSLFIITCTNLYHYLVKGTTLVKSSGIQILDGKSGMVTNGKTTMSKLPILKTESQLKSFIRRHTIVHNEDFDWDDCFTLEDNDIFLDGKKVVERFRTFENWGADCHEIKRVIALYLPRKTGSSQGSQP